MEKIEKSNTKDVFLWDLKDMLYEINLHARLSTSTKPIPKRIS